MNRTKDIPPFETIQITDESGQVMPVKKGYPKKFKNYILLNANVYCAEGPAGVFLFQQIAKGDFSFWISYYFSNGRGRIKADIRRPTFELHFMLENDLYYKLKNLAMQPMKGLQYNLLYAPDIHNEVIMEGKVYVTFDVHFPLAVLEEIGGGDPQIRDFIARTQEHKTVELFRSPVFATPRMLYLLRVLQEHLSSNDGEMQLLPFEAAIRELLVLALIRKGTSKRGWTKYYHAEQLFYAEQTIRSGFDNPNILAEARGQTGLSDYKFRRTFSEIFAQNPSEFLHKLRMDAALELLADKNNRVKDVAYLVGYTDPNSFTTEFSHYFGHPPGQSR